MDAKNFNQAMEIVAEMAREKSCYFHVQAINNNSGESRTLNKIECSNNAEDDFGLF